MRPIGGSETAEPECEAQPHPLARLPAIDIVIPSFGGRERRLDLKVGPGGLALFSVTCDDFALHHVTVILDWVKGEGRGVSILAVHVNWPTVTRLVHYDSARRGGEGHACFR